MLNALGFIILIQKGYPWMGVSLQIKFKETNIRSLTVALGQY